MQEVQAIFTIFSFVYFTWIPVLCLVMPTDIVLILLQNFILLGFCFSATCVNLIFLLFTVYINSSLFRLENGRNSLVQMIQNHLVFLILQRFICLLVYLIKFTMNPCVTSITLNTLMIFCNRSTADLQGNFITIFLNAKAKIELGRK